MKWENIEQSVSKETPYIFLSQSIVLPGIGKQKVQMRASPVIKVENLTSIYNGPNRTLV